MNISMWSITKQALYGFMCVSYAWFIASSHTLKHHHYLPMPLLGSPLPQPQFYIMIYHSLFAIHTSPWISHCFLWGNVFFFWLSLCHICIFTGMEHYSHFLFYWRGYCNNFLKLRSNWYTFLLCCSVSIWYRVMKYTFSNSWNTKDQISCCEIWEIIPRMLLGGQMLWSSADFHI